MPLGHGPKSAMIVKQYIELTTPEMYAIWWHMGFNGNFENDTAAGASYEKYPLALALYTADMMASRLMEAEAANKALFAEPPLVVHVPVAGRFLQHKGALPVLGNIPALFAIFHFGAIAPNRGDRFNTERANLSFTRTGPATRSAKLSG